MRLGKYELPHHADLRMQGFASWDNPGNQIHCMLLHYTADPEKRSLKWEQQARAGFGDGDWDQEMEIDFGSWAGLPVFRRFMAGTHVAREPLPWVPHVNWPILLGWDIGIHACVWAQRYREQFHIFHAEQIVGAFEDKKFGAKYKAHEVDCSGLGTFIDHCMVRTKEMFGEGVTLKHVADPAAAHHTIVREEKPVDIFRRKGIHLSYGSTQDTVTRISAVEDWLKQNTNSGTPAFQVDPGALLVIDGMSGGYAFTKQQKPDKGPFSHCVTGDTQIATPLGSKAIADVRVGDLVLTPQGACRVSAVMSQVVDSLVDIQYTGGHHLTATENHPIILVSGERCRADALRPGHQLVGGATVWGDQPFMRSKSLRGFDIIPSHPEATIKVTTATGTGICTAWSGPSIMDQFPQGIMSIIATGIPAITTSQIWNYCWERNIYADISGRDFWQTLNLFWQRWKRGKRRVRHGIARQRVVPFIRNLLNGIQDHEIASPFCVRGVRRNTWETLSRASVGFAPIPAKAWHETSQAWTTKHDPAVSVEPHLSRTSTRNAATVPPHVSVMDVQQHTVPRRVYDLTVDDAHCFYANGILVGNCCNAIEYLCSVNPAPNASKEVLRHFHKRQEMWESDTLGRGFQVGHRQRRLPENWDTI